MQSLISPSLEASAILNNRQAREAFIFFWQVVSSLHLWYDVVGAIGCEERVGSRTRRLRDRIARGAVPLLSPNVDCRHFFCFHVERYPVSDKRKPLQHSEARTLETLCGQVSPQKAMSRNEALPQSQPFCVCAVRKKVNVGPIASCGPRAVRDLLRHSHPTWARRDDAPLLFIFGVSRPWGRYGKTIGRYLSWFTCSAAHRLAMMSLTLGLSVPFVPQSCDDAIRQHDAYQSTLLQPILLYMQHTKD